MQPLVGKRPPSSAHHSSSRKPVSGKTKSNPFGDGKKHLPATNKPVSGSTSLQYVQVDHVFMHQQSPGKGGNSADTPSQKGNGNKDVPRRGYGQGIECKWQTAPEAVDKGRVLLLLQIQQFVNDSRVRSKVIEVRSNGQEAFVHEVNERTVVA